MFLRKLQDLFQTQNHSDQIQGVFKQQQFCHRLTLYLQTVGYLRFEQSICQSFCHLLNTHIVMVVDVNALLCGSHLEVHVKCPSLVAPIAPFNQARELEVLGC